jgi:cytochrome c oxidase subunit 3
MPVTAVAMFEDSPAIAMQEDRRARQGVWLLLASLGVFFLASMILFVLYIATRLGSTQTDLRSYALPLSFLWSTFLLVGVSVSLHYAVVAARADETLQVFRLCGLASLFAALFFVVQSHGMYVLMLRSLGASMLGLSPYAFTFLLAFVHAMHVVGGVIALVAVVGQAWRQQYDHERHWGLVFCAMYWHFLDAVWLVMLGGFVLSIALIQRSAVQLPTTDHGVAPAKASIAEPQVPAESAMGLVVAPLPAASSVAPWSLSGVSKPLS